MTNEELIELVKKLNEEVKTLSDTIDIHAILLNELSNLLEKSHESAI